MPEKKNNQKPKGKPKGKPQDLRKKYPVDKILSQALESSIDEIAKEHKISKSLVAKIIKRYGSEELKGKVSSRHPKRKKEEEEKKVNEESAKFLKSIGENLEELMTPLDNYAEIKKENKEERERVKQTITGGDEVVRVVLKAMQEKELDEEVLEKWRETLLDFMRYKLSASRLYLEYLKHETALQESFIKVEVIAKKMEGTKNILNTFFDSLNLLNGKEYRAIKEFITNAHPFTHGLFSQFEERLDEFRRKVIAERNQGRGGATAEGGRTKEETSSNNSN